MAQLQERITALEQENTRLYTELQDGERSLASQARVAELERTNALLQAEVAEHRWREQVLQGQLQALTKQAAIAKEQEQPASELAKANILRRSLSWLADEGDLNQFLARVLLEIASTAQADLAYLFVLQEPERMLELTARVLNGALSAHPTPTEPAIFSTSFSADITPAFRYMEEQNLFLTLDMAMLQPELREIMWPDPLIGICGKGAVQVAALVLKAGDRSVGFLGLGFREPREFAQEERELIIALANQASLAILLIRLAEAAKQAAIAREQEKAAIVRATQLAKANKALKRNLDSLATQPELEAFLQSVVNEAAAQTSAANAYIFLYDEHTHSLSLSVATDNGGDWRSVADMELWKRTFPAHCTRAWEIFTSSRIPVVLSLEQAKDLLWAGTFEWHQQRGHTRIIVATLWLSEKPLGFLGLGFTVDETFTPEELELIQALAQQATLAIELTRLAEQSRHTAILEERNRIAREIHDGLGQAFTGIVMQLEAANRFLTTKPQQVPHCITRAQNLAQTGIMETQRSLWTLNQAADEYSNLAATLKRLAAEMATGTAVRVEVTVCGSQPDLPPDIGLHLLRIGQEALTNALKHAQAQQIDIRLTFASHQVQLLVQDDGRGFAPQRLTNSGFGLKSMQQRAEHIGACLIVASQPGSGTQVRLTAPLAAINGSATAT